MNSERQAARWPVLVALALLVLITLIFIIEFVLTTESELAAPTPVALAADTYREAVSALLADADAASGAQLVEKYNCIACHRLGAENKIAPPFAGVAERAATRRPPLTASAYIYESVTQPMAFVVDGFTPAMPQNYPDLLAEQELGDIIAYLLMPDAH